MIETEGVEAREGWTKLGCGVAREGRYRFRRGKRHPPKICRNRDHQWARHLDAVRPDIAVVLFGPWDVSDRQLPGDD